MAWESIQGIQGRCVSPYHCVTQYPRQDDKELYLGEGAEDRAHGAEVWGGGGDGGFLFLDELFVVLLELLEFLLEVGLGAINFSLLLVNELRIVGRCGNTRHGLDDTVVVAGTRRSRACIMACTWRACGWAACRSLGLA